MINAESAERMFSASSARSAFDVVTPARITRAILTTPLGDMLALDSGNGLCALEFTGPKKRLPRLEARLHRYFPRYEIVDGETATIRQTRQWLDRYFAGTSADISGLRMDMRGAAFELRVWAALRGIAPGTTTSYGAIAKALGSAGASRAVGMANGANPIAIIVPCHRVIGASGSLTGYGGGLERKTWLIEHERRWRTEPQASLF
jgi:methylated-DNA-[protein]-cysteine S-methyltransferase